VDVTAADGRQSRERAIALTPSAAAIPFADVKVLGRWRRIGANRSIDAIDTAWAAKGLTGTAPASVYRPLRDAEQVTIAPDGRPMEEQPAWRRDFPIDWPQDHYVERRDFMKFMVLTSLRSRSASSGSPPELAAAAARPAPRCAGRFDRRGARWERR
jgi:hypothetical protein